MTILYLVLAFMRIGILGFGGGYAMLPIIFQTVQEFGVMTQDEFAWLIALSQVTPGPVAINAATYVGFNTAGIVGALAATAGIALPSFILVYMVSHFLDKFKESTVINAGFTGIRPVTIGLIGTAVIYIGEASMFNGTFSVENIMKMGYGYIEAIPVIICLIAILLNGKLKVNPIFVTLGGGVVGLLLLS